jgi:hypothetical protein
VLQVVELLKLSKSKAFSSSPSTGKKKKKGGFHINSYIFTYFLIKYAPMYKRGRKSNFLKIKNLRPGMVAELPVQEVEMRGS